MGDYRSNDWNTYSYTGRRHRNITNLFSCDPTRTKGGKKGKKRMGNKEKNAHFRELQVINVTRYLQLLPCDANRKYVTVGSVREKDKVQGKVTPADRSLHEK